MSAICSTLKPCRVRRRVYASGCRIVVHVVFAAVETVTRQNRDERDANRSDVSLPSHLCNKAAAGFQHAAHFGKHGILSAHPMQRRIREDGIEGAVCVRQRLRFAFVHVNATRPRSGSHLG